MCQDVFINNNNNNNNNNNHNNNKNNNNNSTNNNNNKNIFPASISCIVMHVCLSFNAVLFKQQAMLEFLSFVNPTWY